MAVREVKLTKEGYERLQAELAEAKAALIEATRILREQMESSDDYDDTGLEDAKREKASIEAKIDQLEDILGRAVIIEAGGGDVVSLGSTVLLQSIADKREYELTVVSGAEARVLENKISDESPVGSKLMGKKAGDTFKVRAPEGSLEYRVMAVNVR